MFTIFTSTKTLRLTTELNPHTVVTNFQNRVGEDGILTRLKNAFSHTGEIVGRVDGRTLKMKLVSAVSNPFQPEMIVQVDADIKGGAVVNTRYAVPLFPKLFIIVWIVGATTIALTALTMGKSDSRFIPILFPFFGVFFILLGRLIALRDQQRLERLVHEVVAFSSRK
jgi:hypothetical protein